MISVYRAAALSAALVLGGGILAVPAQAQDCRSIADPNLRLACYDRQQGAPASAPAPAPAAEPARAEPNRTGLREEKAPAPARKSGFRSTIVGISPMSFGLYELRLADGSVWSTTTSGGGTRPNVGDAITYRRSFTGAHFFDIKGRRSVTVRRER